MKIFALWTRFSRRVARAYERRELLADMGADTAVISPALGVPLQQSTQVNTAAGPRKFSENAREQQALQVLQGVLSKGIPGARLQVVRVRRQRESIIYTCKFSSSAVAQGVLLKIFRNGPEEARSQFETLQSLWPLFCRGGVDLAVPRPIAFLPEFSAIAMEEIPGSDLLELFRKHRWRIIGERNWAQFLAAVRKSGRWLRQLHDFDRRAEDRCLDTSAIMDGAKMEAEESLQFGMTADFVVGVLAHLHSKLAEYANQPFRTPRVHGDFKLDNMIVTASGVAGVDIAMGQEGPIYRDLSSFCNSIELLRLDPRNIHLSRGRIAKLQDEFLSAYFEGEPYSRELVGGFQVVGLLAKYIYLCRQHPRPILHRLYLTPFFTSCLRHAIGDTSFHHTTEEVKP